MKKLILLWAGPLLLILFGLNLQARAQCAASDKCFDFRFNGIERLSNNNVRLSFTIKTNCDHDLSYAAFELPAGAKAVNPKGSKYNYGVENTTNNPFYSVKFEGKNIKGYKNGAEDTFTYELTNAQYASLNKMKLQAKASTTVGTVSIDLANCDSSDQDDDSGDGSDNDNGGDNGDDDSGDDEGEDNGNINCSDSQPRPIIGDEHPCPGETATYYIENDRNYTSFEWDVPRAHAGEPPVGWEILSGQGTSKVTVRVGQKSGTMKVKVNDPVCGTKVATLDVQPGKSFKVIIDGPDSVCPNESQTFSASVKKENGQGNVKGEFTYTWTVPAGWVIESGKNSEKLIVKPSSTPGEVNVYVSSNAQEGGKDKSGPGLGGGPKGYCANASDGLMVKMKEDCGSGTVCPPLSITLAALDTACNLSDDTYRFEVSNIQEGVSYEFVLPDGFVELDEGNGFVEVVAIFEEDQLGQEQIISVTARNDCGEETTTTATVVVIDCNEGDPSGEPETPLPVTMTRFQGVSRNGAIELLWSTATEINNDRFDVERSYDGGEFSKIGEVKGNGNASVSIDYTFTDVQAAKGTVYYRLRQVDYDGAFEYSKVIAVSHSGSIAGTSLSVYPNPVTDDKVNIRFASAPQGEIIIRLVDLKGRTVHASTLNGKVSEALLDIQSLGLGQGIYLLSVTNGGKTDTQRLMIK